MAHFLAISVTVLDSQNTQLLHHLHLNKMRILIKQTIPCMMMLSSLCFRKFPVLRSKSIQSGKCPNTWINLLDKARTAPLTLLQHTEDPLSSTEPLNQTPKRSCLQEPGLTLSQGHFHALLVQHPNLQEMGGLTECEAKVHKAGFPSAHCTWISSSFPGPTPRAAHVQSSVPGEIILSQEQRVEPVNGLGDVGEVPAVRVSNARAWKTNLRFIQRERNNWNFKNDPPFPRREEKHLITALHNHCLHQKHHWKH